MEFAPSASHLLDPNDCTDVGICHILVAPRWVLRPSGYRLCVFPPVAHAVARLSRHSLCAAVAVALSMACLGLAFAALTAPMTGMAGMADTSPEVAPEVAAQVLPDVPTGGVAVGDSASGAAVMSQSMSAMCDSGACVTDVIAVCTIAGGLIVGSLLALLRASRRDTFVGLLTRRRSRSPVGRRRRHASWTVPSHISLRVLRV